MATAIVILLNVVIWLIIIRQLLPPPRLSHGGEPLDCISATRVFDNRRLYFNGQGLFIFRRRELLAHYPFSALQALEKTALTINNRRVWRLQLVENGQSINEDFRPRRAGFRRFYQYLEENQPTVARDRLRWFD